MTPDEERIAQAHTHGITFGQAVRAYRLRWGILPAPAQGLMRLSPAPGGCLCELRPLGLVPQQLSEGGEYYLWWQDNKEEAIASSRFLRSLREIKQPFSVVLNEQGEVVR